MKVSIPTKLAVSYAMIISDPKQNSTLAGLMYMRDEKSSR